MKIRLDARKSIHANAAAYFEKSKQAREKANRVRKAIVEVEQKIRVLLEKQLVEEQSALQKISVKIPSKREWFEKFHWFETSGGKLCIAGRDAKQNEILVGKYLEEGDLFFHADVQGAAATILKNGAIASEKELQEAAQFAACFSKAWKAGYSSVDVYAVGKGQVSKSPQSGEYLGKGAFVMRGERKWFRNTSLKLFVGKNERGKITVSPLEKNNFVEIAPGKEKKELAQEIAAKLRLGKPEKEELMQLLP